MAESICQGSDANGSLETEISSASPRQVFSITLCGIFYVPGHGIDTMQEEGTNNTF